MPPDDKPIDPAVAAPVVAAAPAAPAAEPAAPAAVVELSQASAASEVPAKDAGATEVAPKTEPSLLQTFDADKAAKEAKPADAAKPVDAKPADATKPAADAAKPDADATKAAADATKPAEPAKPEPVEYKYTLPETVKLDDTNKAALHTAFDAFRADPTNPQPLIDLHNKLVSDFAAQTDANQRRVFNDYRAENRKAVMADPEIGGSGHQTAMGAIARMRDLLAPKGSLEPRKFDDGKPRLSELDEFLESTGAGDHPLFLKMLHNVARFLDEPQADKLPANPRPTKVRAPKGGGIYSEESRAKMNGT